MKKKVDRSNWLAPDPYLPPEDPSSWLEKVMKPVFPEPTPKDVCEMFEAAQGAMVYGVLFFPLFRLAMEQLMLVRDTAVLLACEKLSGPGVKASYDERIQWLQAHGMVTDLELPRWELRGKVGSEYPHPNFQKLCTPSVVERELMFTFADVIFLFRRVDATSTHGDAADSRPAPAGTE